jgi:maltose O-acetyltransferase
MNCARVVMSEFQKMVSGQPFRGEDGEIMDVRRAAFEILQELNRCWPMDNVSLLKTLLGSVGEGTLLVPPFQCEFGKNITIGNGTLVNMGATILDGARVHIGDDVMIGPSCQI